MKWDTLYLVDETGGIRPFPVPHPAKRAPPYRAQRSQPMRALFISQSAENALEILRARMERHFRTCAYDAMDHSVPFFPWYMDSVERCTWNVFQFIIQFDTVAEIVLARARAHGKRTKADMKTIVNWASRRLTINADSFSSTFRCGDSPRARARMGRGQKGT